MDEIQRIKVWAGERKLLPLKESSAEYQLRCIAGDGYLRIMSLATRQYFKAGDELIIPGEEIVTLTGMQTMHVELTLLRG